MYEVKYTLTKNNNKHIFTKKTSTKVVHQKVSRDYHKVVKIYKVAFGDL